MRLHHAVLAAALITSSAAALALGGGERCKDMLPSDRVPAGKRPLVSEDLLRLRDIGPIDAESSAAPLFTISPDGTRAAFQLRQADPEANTYCLAMVVVDLASRAPPTIIDQGGDVLLLTIDNAGTADFPTGIPDVVTPRWSPDGRWIAFRKRVAGRTQVWRAAADGSGSRQLTHSADDVLDFRIEADGSSLVFVTRPGTQRAREAIDGEGLSGFHFDDRWAPTDGNHPFPAPPIRSDASLLDLRTGQVRPATAAESASATDGSGRAAPSPSPEASGPSPRLRISQTTLMGGARAGSLHARLADGSWRTCESALCEGATDPWFLADGQRVRFFRREGWALGSTAIYEWAPARASVHRLHATQDVLSGCAPSGEMLVCLRESSLQPRRLEWLDPATGGRRLIFDPNPEFAGLVLGKVRRLRWRNSFGLEAFGDLVLPVEYRPGQRYPLVVVQYRTRGFLRGGTGDEYPIQAFASRGYAVLSVQRPIPIALARGARTFHEGDRLNMIGFADHRSVFSSLRAGVNMAVAEGVADPKRMGITGLSNGATNIVWALLHSSLFKAAAMSSCCFDTTLAARVGPVSAREYREVGYPGMLDRNAPFWRDISLSTNARRIRTPILLQLADYEYLNALESYTALREAGAPIDMFVFPNEYHNKWQPAHRLAVYRRSLDWFDFWLRGVRSQAQDRWSDLEHWDALRAATRSSPLR